jgi:hypothetical protein
LLVGVVPAVLPPLAADAAAAPLEPALPVAFAPAWPGVPAVDVTRAPLVPATLAGAPAADADALAPDRPALAPRELGSEAASL